MDFGRESIRKYTLVATAVVERNWGTLQGANLGSTFEQFFLNALAALEQTCMDLHEVLL